MKIEWNQYFRWPLSHSLSSDSAVGYRALDVPYNPNHHYQHQYADNLVFISLVSFRIFHKVGWLDQGRKQLRARGSLKFMMHMICIYCSDIRHSYSFCSMQWQVFKLTWWWIRTIHCMAPCWHYWYISFSWLWNMAHNSFPTSTLTRREWILIYPFMQTRLMVFRE